MQPEFTIQYRSTDTLRIVQLPYYLSSGPEDTNVLLGRIVAGSKDIIQSTSAKGSQIQIGLYVNREESNEP